MALCGRELVHNLPNALPQVLTPQWFAWKEAGFDDPQSPAFRLTVPVSLHLEQLGMGPDELLFDPHLMRI
jgi:hypothetical protein